MIDTSPLPADAGSSPTSCSTHMYSPSLTSYSSVQSVDLLNTSLLVGLGLQSLDVPYQRPETTRSKQQLPDLIEGRLRSLLGEPLATVDLDSIQLMPLRSCLPWEIVAVKDSDGVLRYGEVMDEGDPSSSAEVKVQVSKTCIWWYAMSQIYFFQSIGKRMTSKVVDVWIGDKEETEASTVGVVAEVNALLARLNSLSTSYEELLDEVWRLQHRVALVEEDRRAALQQIEQALRAQRDAEKALVCAVCLVNVVDRVLIPCGHSYCTTCVKRLDGSSCPVCRHDISDSAAFRIS
ncbi:unnamed protein product [Peronospora destructor]|uniref:RING-type domain-containing protein n=1 Tax=Peronospora destructor TaxID=86335 RepID=A0AAV0VBW1_9STRA|nr:unnamed protein product [Peronospora destructor]